MKSSFPLEFMVAVLWILGCAGNSESTPVDNTPYEVALAQGELATCVTVRTQPESLSFDTSETLYVDVNAESGGDGSDNAPFVAIQAAVDSPVTMGISTIGTPHAVLTSPITSGRMSATTPLQICAKSQHWTVTGMNANRGCPHRGTAIFL